jgi:hypothetical protein
MLRIGAALKSEINKRWGDNVGVDPNVFRAEQPNYLAPTHAKLIHLNGALLVADEWLARPDAINLDKNSRTIEQRVLETAKSDPVYRKLEEEGMIIGPNKKQGSFNCSCPFEEEHSEKTADSSTVYFLPNFNGYAKGNFHCLHAHCADRTLNEFIEKLGLNPELVRREQILGFPPLSEEEQRKANLEKFSKIGKENPLGIPVQRIMRLKEMLDELVLVADGSRVAYVSNPNFSLSLQEFKIFSGGSFDVIDGKRGGERKQYRLDVWKDHPERLTVETVTFAPGQSAVCMSPDNRKALNLWIKINRNPPENWEDFANSFEAHVAYLIPILSERKRFLDWLAHLEQRPGELPTTHYLLVTKQTGIGRNWLAGALAHTYPGYAALGFDLSGSLRSGFNGQLGGKLLAVVDELHEGGPKSASKPQAEKLKSMLTETTRMINPKFGRQRTEFNCCRFLMFSNHEAALPLADNDRRVIVIQNPAERQSKEYYEQLYQMIEKPGFGDAIGYWLSQRDISSFKYGDVAPINDAKLRVIRAGRSEIEQTIRDIAEQWPSDCISGSSLLDAVRSTLGEHVRSTQGAAVDAGLLKLGRHKVGGQALNIWALRNVDKWRKAEGTEIAAEVIKGEPLSNLQIPSVQKSVQPENILIVQPREKRCSILMEELL